LGESRENEIKTAASF